MATVSTKLRVPHFVRGRVVWGDESEYVSRDFGVPFVTPKLQLNEWASNCRPITSRRSPRC
jgi:hypothetical protein